MNCLTEECEECRGNKVVPQKITLALVCPKCSGRGGKDWISKAMGKENTPDMNILHEVCMKNVQHLMHLIREECAKIGIIAEIEIKTKHMDYSWESRYNYPNMLYGGR